MAGSHIASPAFIDGTTTVESSPTAGSTDSHSDKVGIVQRFVAWLTKKAIGHPIISSIIAALLAGAVAALPLLYQLASLYSTALKGELSNILTNHFYTLFGFWIGFILLASFSLAYSQLKSAEHDVDYLAEKMDTTERKLSMTLDGMQQVSSAIRTTTDSLQTSMADTTRKVGSLKDSVEQVDQKISHDVQRSVNSVRELAQETATAARQALETLKLGTLIRTINQTITSALMTEFFCGSEIKTLKDSRFLVYLRSGTPPDHVTPFYLEPHALSARNGSSSDDDPKIQDLLQIARCAATRKGLAWRLSEREKTSVWTLMRMSVREAVTMPVVFDSDLAGVLVVLRSPLKPLFFEASGAQEGCFGAATNAVANIADEIAPLLAQARRELDARV